MDPLITAATRRSGCSPRAGLPGLRETHLRRFSSFSAGGSILAETLDSNEIRVFDVLRKTWRSLVRTSKLLGYPWWSHDGMYVYFNTERNPPDFAASIWRVRVGDRKVEEVLKLKEKLTGNLGEWSRPRAGRFDSGSSRPRRSGSFRAGCFSPLREAAATRE